MKPQRFGEGTGDKWPALLGHPIREQLSDGREIITPGESLSSGSTNSWVSIGQRTEEQRRGLGGSNLFDLFHRDPPQHGFRVSARLHEQREVCRGIEPTNSPDDAIPQLEVTSGGPPLGDLRGDQRPLGAFVSHPSRGKHEVCLAFWRRGMSERRDKRL
jgi:hypothetical protein